MKRILTLTVLCLAVLPLKAHENEVSITETRGEICIQSNGTPDHDIGTFPNSGNPHSFEEQSLTICVDATPELTGRTVERTNASGITLSGIIIRPGTADYYDASSPRGFSRDASSGWRLEGMGAAALLGMDSNAGHVDQAGLYHYHGISEGMLEASQGSQFGYAADGFELHYVGSGATSSWQLKSGTRPTAPYGAYDGTYEQDWEYVPGSGNLDACNGAMVNGEYTYFATDTFPFFPRCFKGSVSDDFTGRPQAAASSPRAARAGQGQRPRFGQYRPPHPPRFLPRN